MRAPVAYRYLFPVSGTKPINKVYHKLTKLDVNYYVRVFTPILGSLQHSCSNIISFEILIKNRSIFANLTTEKVCSFNFITPTLYAGTNTSVAHTDRTDSFQ